MDCFSYYKLIHRHIQEKEAPVSVDFLFIWHFIWQIQF